MHGQLYSCPLCITVYPWFSQFVPGCLLFINYLNHSCINVKGDFLYHQDEEAPESIVPGNRLLRIVERQRVKYCAMAVKRKVYEYPGGFYGVSHGEDWEMWARIATHYKAAYTPAIPADYRVHINSVSGHSFRNGQNMKDLHWVMNTMSKYVLPEQRERIRRETNEFYACYALRIANKLWNTDQIKKDAKTQIREAVKLLKNPYLFWKITRLNLKILMPIS